MNKRQRMKTARRNAKKTGKVYQPRNIFRSTIPIQSTLFDINHPKNEKLVYLADRNLNRLAFVISKPNIINLTNLTEDEVKYLQGATFSRYIDDIEQYFVYDRSLYKDPTRIDNITREVMTDYFSEHRVDSTRALDIAMRRLTKQLEEIVRTHTKEGWTMCNPFVIVYYERLELY